MNWVELTEGSSNSEIAYMLLFLIGIGFVLMVPFVAILGKIVALKKKPQARALWTTSLAYAAAAILVMLWMGPMLPPWIIPLLPLPGAAVIFFWLRMNYRKAWLEDHQVDGSIDLENDDWRVGIITLILIAVIATARFVFSGMEL
ncbi:hypothetical protein [Paraurantiacibacter namhicola]|uniref:Uncharacterized protein n=1 Tax=Paraurantiacibacter namhicola TaxID=645517 RepID=A0A1C7D4E3_9SPHN|nr:hypothetical protein [Paraurantiacibacter namhicola]ANU06337.1 hypothetical protein A6F65_00009 [Paraurantiacibacter namhicola]